MDYYDNMKNEGEEYQDFVVEQLWKEGIVCIPYSSKKKQYNGESLNGIEIKYDRKFRQTKRLYIETHEKSNHTNSKWVESGILKKDNSWLFVIGDYKDIFIFSKKQLQLEFKKAYWATNETATSKCLFLDLNDENIKPLIIKHIKVK